MNYIIHNFKTRIFKYPFFDTSKVTIVYARTEEDADRFNLSSDKSSGLTFIVKKSQY